MKHFIILLMSALLLFGCTEERAKSDMIVAAKTEASMMEAAKAVPLPAIKNWQEKKMLKRIYELRDQESMICYAYIVNINGDLKYMGKCSGYGMPYSTQFSNPQKVVNYRKMLGSSVADNSSGLIPQPEPNGLFMPPTLTATWLLMFDENMVEHPVYFEPEIIVSPFPMHDQ